METPLLPLLRDIPPADLAPLLTGMGQPTFRADQLARWLYDQGVVEWERMSNMPATLRDALAESHDLSGLALAERQCSQDGTRKFLFTLRDGQTVESVIIPMEQHATFCVSSQVGCAMACSFCATARGGLVRQLTRGEILEQVLRLAADLEADPVPGLGGRAFNVVFMGMGEPLDNVEEVAGAVAAMTGEPGMGISPRRITVSTSGPADGMRAFLDLELNVGLTLSVNTCDAGLRKKLMPVPGRTPLAESLVLAEEHALRTGRAATVAYVLIDGVNDDVREAEALADLVHDRPFKVNLIPMNRIDERFGPPEPATMLAFQERLAGRGVRATIRISGGDDIDAACGQLRRRASGRS